MTKHTHKWRLSKATPVSDNEYGPWHLQFYWVCEGCTCTMTTVSRFYVSSPIQGNLPEEVQSELDILSSRQA